MSNYDEKIKKGLDMEKVDYKYYNNIKKSKSNIYITTTQKFILSLILSCVWMVFSYNISKAWIHDLSKVVGPVWSFIIISGVAYVPGFMNAFLVVSLLLDKQPIRKINNPYESVTLLIAAYNEEAGIYDTLRYVNEQRYNGKINIVVIDNNSSDETASEVERAKKDFDKDITLLKETKPGKFNALNKGLKYVKTKYVITLDADTIIHKDAINNLVSRMVSSPDDVCAVAGSMLVRNSRDNILSKMQEWDYFLSIASIKRMQGLYQGTLVAQGAFSIYKTDIVRNFGGWADAIGEDIILTWKILSQNKRVYFEPKAIAFTDVPTKLSHFAKQRSRWARGMIEGIREVKPWQQPKIFFKFLTGIDLLIPYMDFSYTFFWIPGLILAVFFHKYYIVGPMMIFVLPLTLVSFYILYRYQAYNVFRDMNLKVRKNILGLTLFLLTYQMIMSPVSLYGYMQEMLGLKRVWK